MSKRNYINNQYQDFFEKSLLDIDPDIHKAINDELKDSKVILRIIASENIVSKLSLKLRVLKQINMLKVILSDC